MFRAPAVFTALLLALVSSLPHLVEAGCLLEHGVTTPGEHDAYSCLRSSDFRKDLDKLPLNTSRLVNVAFWDGNVPRIDKEDLQRLGTRALGLSIVHCGLEDVHEEAFRGLTALKGLILRRNRLTEVKKNWFTDLANLESLDLSGNMIREFDPNIFDLTPLMQEFEISENQLTRFDVDAMKSKWSKLKRVGLQWNPYEWAQGVKIIEYSNIHPDIVKNSYTSIDGMRDTAKLVKDCLNTILKKDDAKELDDCMQAKLTEAAESPKLLQGEKPVEPIKTG